VVLSDLEIRSPADSISSGTITMVSTSDKLKTNVSISHIMFPGSNEPVPDDDPLDKCNGHGTHVSVRSLSSFFCL